MDSATESGPHAPKGRAKLGYGCLAYLRDKGRCKNRRSLRLFLREMHPVLASRRRSFSARRNASTLRAIASLQDIHSLDSADLVERPSGTLVAGGTDGPFAGRTASPDREDRTGRPRRGSGSGDASFEMSDDYIPPRVGPEYQVTDLPEPSPARRQEWARLADRMTRSPATPFTPEPTAPLWTPELAKEPAVQVFLHSVRLAPRNVHRPFNISRSIFFLYVRRVFAASSGRISGFACGTRSCRQCERSATRIPACDSFWCMCSSGRG